MRKVLTNEPQLDIATEAAADTNGWVIIRATGELDLATAPRLLEHVTGLTEDHRCPHVVLDLADLGFCDSTGLGTLITLHKRMQAAAGVLVLAGLTGQPLDLLARTGMDRRLALAADVAAATARSA
ncbi:anti-sigma B factor antagonist [Thermomonospora echinospora]|uniref:Anti-sigma factor antagonist n=1 Tax=Thermomonospora echinospora TaxID=1992 RepID=A0A1H6E8N6_9ACTN|nr:STAS domain-containing protein [Thermomonospora echinospora]SEG93489.1 anti-sigma B factor antagonist [Thermomonospora echinospora]